MLRHTYVCCHDVHSIEVYERYPIEIVGHYVGANAQLPRARVGRYSRWCYQRWGEYTTAHVPCGCVCWDSFKSPDPHALTIRLLRPCGNNRVFLATHRIGVARYHNMLVAWYPCVVQHWSLHIVEKRNDRNISNRNHRIRVGFTNMIRGRTRKPCLRPCYWR